MEKLPTHLLDEALFRLPHKSLASLKCTNRAFRSHISSPEFKSVYISRVGPGLLHVSSYGSGYICYVPFVSEEARANMPIECQILGSLGGLILLFMHRLCIVNPITQQFRFLNHENSKVMNQIAVHDREGRFFIHKEKAMHIGFAVDQIDRSSQMFEVVCISETRIYPDDLRYEFEIYDNRGSWRKSTTRIASSASILDWHVKPVYFNGYLHWLRTDGNIIAFNPWNEHARIIDTKFPGSEPGVKRWFGAVDGKLTLVSATAVETSVFALRDSGKFAGWEIVERIKNSVLKRGEWTFWNVATYDGKFLVLHETTRDGRTLHGYDVVANKWKVLGSTPTWADSNRDFLCFVPSWSSVRGLKNWPSATEVEAREHLRVFIELFDRICREI